MKSILEGCYAAITSCDDSFLSEIRVNGFLRHSKLLSVSERIL